MSVKLGLISDVHACAAPVREALSIFRREGVASVLCNGDIAGYGNELAGTVEVLRQSGCTSLQGNHDIWYLEKHAFSGDKAVAEYLSHLPDTWESIVEGIHIYAVHASPPHSMNRGIRLLDEQGRLLPDEKERWAKELEEFSFDVLVIGHTHQLFAERLGNTLVINPGSTRFNHTCAVLSLPEMDLRVFNLSGKEPVKAWNWGMIAREKPDGTDQGSEFC